MKAVLEATGEKLRQKQSKENRNITYHRTLYVVVVEVVVDAVAGPVCMASWAYGSSRFPSFSSSSWQVAQA